MLVWASSVTSECLNQPHKCLFHDPFPLYNRLKTWSNSQISPTTNRGKLRTKYWNWWNWHWVRQNRSIAWKRRKWHQRSHFHWRWHGKWRRIVFAYSFIFKCSVWKFWTFKFPDAKKFDVTIFGTFERPKIITSDFFLK